MIADNDDKSHMDVWSESLTNFFVEIDQQEGDGDKVEMAILSFVITRMWDGSEKCPECQGKSVHMTLKGKLWPLTSWEMLLNSFVSHWYWFKPVETLLLGWTPEFI